MANTILILGAKSDIGRAVAHYFAEQGFNVQLAARNAADVSNDVSDLKLRYSVNVSAYDFDVLNFNTHPDFVSELTDMPDVVICVIGLLGDQLKAQKEWQHTRMVMDSNYSGPVSILNCFANAFEQRQRGCIIGISSVAGDRGRQSNYIYGSSKSAFSVYLSGLRNRLYKSGVNVLTVKPGFVNTKMTAEMDLPEKLTAEPEQVAKDIFKAYTKNKAVIYTRWFWRWIMLTIKNIPESIFKKLSL